MNNRINCGRFISKLKRKYDEVVFWERRDIDNFKDQYDLDATQTRKDILSQLSCGHLIQDKVGHNENCEKTDGCACSAITGNKKTIECASFEECSKQCPCVEDTNRWPCVWVFKYPFVYKSKTVDLYIKLHIADYGSDDYDITCMNIKQS